MLTLKNRTACQNSEEDSLLSGLIQGNHQNKRLGCHCAWLSQLHFKRKQQSADIPVFAQLAFGKSATIARTTLLGGCREVGIGRQS
jgi:hypothetical protein